MTEELWEVQCIQMPGVVGGSELSYKDMHNSERHLEIYFFKSSAFDWTKNKLG